MFKRKKNDKNKENFLENSTSNKDNNNNSLKLQYFDIPPM